MVEGAKSFFKSTVLKADDKNFHVLSTNGTYTNSNLIVLQASKTVEHIHQYNFRRKFFEQWETLYLVGGVFVDINGSVHSSMWSFEAEELSSAILCVALPEINTFVWALPSPSVTFDVTRTILYTIDHRNTAPICSKSFTLVAEYCKWLPTYADLHKSGNYTKYSCRMDLQPLTVKNMLVHKSGKHQGFQTGFPSLCKELEWWWERYCPNCLHPSIKLTIIFEKIWKWQNMDY